MVVILLAWLCAVAAAADPARVAAWSDAVVRLEMGGASCAGVVIDEAGTVATAYHCVAGSRRPWVSTRAGARHRGRVSATSARDDLALVAVPGMAGAVAPRPLRQGPVRVGEALLAIGHPLGGEGDAGTAWEGVLGWSVSEGIVSAVGPRLLQTDAALNPGTSGGPGLDAEGQVLGIVSRKLGGEGLSFLAHVDRLRALAAAPRRPLVGGAVHLGATVPTPLVAGAARSAGLQLQVQVRDRVLLGAGAMLPLDARVQALSAGKGTYAATQVDLGLRQRLGSGSWSSTVDLGGGLFQLTEVTAEWAEESVTTVQRPGPWRPGAQLRLGTRGIGLRGVWIPREGGPQWILALDADWPGVLATF